MKSFVLPYFATMLIMSVVAFLAYGFDKHRAKTNGWRVSEKTLHLMSLLGGWPGAMYGQHVFRHKTQKTSFRMVFWITVAANLACFVLGIAKLMQS